MSRKEHHNISDFVDTLAGTQSHKVSDGTYTGYGRSRRLAEEAFEEAKNTNREYVVYNYDPGEEPLLPPGNHYGPYRGEEVERKKDPPKPPPIVRADEPEPSGSIAQLNARSFNWIMIFIGFLGLLVFLDYLGKTQVGRAAGLILDSPVTGIAILVGIALLGARFVYRLMR